MAYIEFRNVHKSFGNNEVLKGINLSIDEGEFVTLLGPSGCGKSTLLRCFSGLETVTEGEIYLDGTNITDFTPKQRKIGMVFQQYSLFPNMTVRQNVAFGLQMQKKDKHFIAEKVNDVLHTVGLSDKLDQYPRQLSGGQQQRVALARAIIMEPKVLLLDEPLSAIDALLRRNLQVEIRKIQQSLKMTTISSHMIRKRPWLCPTPSICLMWVRLNSPDHRQISIPTRRQNLQPILSDTITSSAIRISKNCAVFPQTVTLSQSVRKPS